MLELRQRASNGCVVHAEQERDDPAGCNLFREGARLEVDPWPGVVVGRHTYYAERAALELTRNRIQAAGSLIDVLGRHERLERIDDLGQPVAKSECELPALVPGPAEEDLHAKQYTEAAARLFIAQCQDR